MKPPAFLVLFSDSFRKTFGQIRDWCPHIWVSVPPSKKFWIRHWWNEIDYKRRTWTIRTFQGMKGNHIFFPTYYSKQQYTKENTKPYEGFVKDFLFNVRYMCRWQSCWYSCLIAIVLDFYPLHSYPYMCEVILRKSSPQIRSTIAASACCLQLP